ncbi:MAG: alpha/beta hydrolase [Terriglobales bacterium]
MLRENGDHVTRRKLGAEEICVYDAGQGAAVVLIHGMFGDFLDWEPVLAPLSRSRRVIALDLPGFGSSSKPRREYTADFVLSTLSELLHDLSIDQATLVGNSFGGQIAILYALAHPEAVAKMVLVNSGGFQRFTPDEIAFTESRFNEAALAALTPEINALLFSPVFVHSSATSAAYLQRQNAKLTRADFPAYAYAIASNIRLSLATYLIDRLPEIACSTLLIWGEQDIVLPLSLAKLALPRLRQGEIAVIPGCGHAPQLECPQQFMASLTPFLEK